MVALSSKCYIAYNNDDVAGESDSGDNTDDELEQAARDRLNDVKLACKGIQKRNNARKLTVRNFKKCLNNQGPIKGVNRGFVIKNNSIFTYQTQRLINPIYIKRRVEPNLRDTKPLHDLSVDCQ